MSPSEVERLDGIADNILLFFPLFYRKILRVANTRARSNPINMQFHVLAMLLHAGVLPASEIGRRLGISRPHVTSLVDKLISSGLAERRHDEQDRRVVRIAATEKGRNFVNNRRRLVRSSIRRNLSGLGEPELKKLYTALDTFKSIISGIDNGK